MMQRELIAERFRELQDYICRELESVDGAAVFSEDLWERDAGGGGRTRTISSGKVIEKGGVAFSEVYGDVSEIMKMQLGLKGENFYATGVSIVLHPENPHVPIIHMNVRYFEMNTGQFWFGGGIDLTPHYIIPAYASDFHRSLKVLCDAYNTEFYDRFKLWADDYFYLTHRLETRGIGGIFFDHQDTSNTGLSKERLFSFCVQLGELFPVLYQHQVSLGKDKPYSNEERHWRNLRRGRYVEFNLVHDRGTKFGLFSGGRTESILMSLPPDASWEYDHSTDKGSPEYNTLNYLKKGIDWLSF